MTREERDFAVKVAKLSIAETLLVMREEFSITERVLELDIDPCF